MQEERVVPSSRSNDGASFCVWKQTQHVKDSKDVFISVFPEHSKIPGNQWYLLVPDGN